MYRMCGESGESSPSPSALCSSEEERGGDRDDGGGCHKDGRSDGARRPEDRQVGRERDSGGKGSRMRCRDDSAGSRDSFYDDARPESEDDIRGGGVPQKERDGRHTRRDRNTDARSEGRKKLCGKPEDSELLPDIRGQGDDQEAADSFRDLHPDARTEEAEQKAEDCDRALDVPHARSEAHPPQDEKPAENEERKPRESHQDPHPKDKKQPAKSQDERPPDAGSQAAEKRRTRRHSLDREIPPVKSPSDLCPDGSKAQSGPPDKNAEEGHPSGRSQDGNKHLGLRSDSSKGHVAPDEQKAISAEAKKRPHCDLDLRDGDRDAPGEAERKPACRRRDSGMRAKETFKDDLPERRPDTGKEGSGGKHLDPHPGATSDNEARDQDEAAGPGRPGNRDQNASGRHAEEESGNEGDASTLSRMDAGVRPSPGGVVARARQSDTRLATASGLLSARAGFVSLRRPRYVSGRGRQMREGAVGRLATFAHVNLCARVPQMAPLCCRMACPSCA